MFRNREGGTLSIFRARLKLALVGWIRDLGAQNSRGIIPLVGPTHTHAHTLIYIRWPTLDSDRTGLLRNSFGRGQTACTSSSSSSPFQLWPYLRPAITYCCRLASSCFGCSSLSLALVLGSPRSRGPGSAAGPPFAAIFHLNAPRGVGGGRSVTMIYHRLSALQLVFSSFFSELIWLLTALGGGVGLSRIKVVTRIAKPGSGNNIKNCFFLLSFD